jgi:metallo-beta-lactamase family protein
MKLVGGVDLPALGFGMGDVVLTELLKDRGLLPKLAREGFAGKIFCTHATYDIAQILLLDAAHLQESDTSDSPGPSKASARS